MANPTDSKPNENQKEPINLRRLYPIAYRSIIRRSLHWLIGLLLIVILLTGIDHLRPADNTAAGNAFFIIGATIFGLAVTLVAAKLIYELIYYHVYYYGTELEHLIISCGIFFKTRGSFPIARMADVYVDRNPIDLIFGLYNLRITTPSPIAEHGSIEGLSSKRAADLQNYLLALVNTTTTPSNEEQATEMLRDLKATEDPAILSASPAAKDPPRAKPQVIPHSSESSGAPPSPDAARKGGSEDKTAAVETHDKPELDTAEILGELKQTQTDLRQARKELAHAGDVLNKAREVIEQTKEEQ